MIDNILEIENNGSTEIVINKSKFLCFSFIARTEEEAKEILNDLNHKYCDATHICYAYKIGGTEKASDNGEPQGTAGKPILDCIKKKNIQNVLVVVVRYFGGIKLGAGGLIRAYSNCAKSVLDISNTKQKFACNKISFSVDFSKQKDLKVFLNDSKILKNEISYAEKISVCIYVLPQNTTFVQNDIELIFETQAQVINEICYI
jgi:uncharacterized YigZ family protein